MATATALRLMTNAQQTRGKTARLPLRRKPTPARDPAKQKQLTDEMLIHRLQRSRDHLHRLKSSKKLETHLRELERTARQTLKRIQSHPHTDLLRAARSKSEKQRLERTDITRRDKFNNDLNQQIRLLRSVLNTISLDAKRKFELSIIQKRRLRILQRKLRKIKALLKEKDKRRRLYFVGMLETESKIRAKKMEMRRPWARGFFNKFFWYDIDPMPGSYLHSLLYHSETCYNYYRDNPNQLSKSLVKRSMHLMLLVGFVIGAITLGGLPALPILCLEQIGPSIIADLIHIVAGIRSLADFTQRNQQRLSLWQTTQPETALPVTHAVAIRPDPRQNEQALPSPSPQPSLTP